MHIEALNIFFQLSSVLALIVPLLTAGRATFQCIYCYSNTTQTVENIKGDCAFDFWCLGSSMDSLEPI